VWTVELRLVLDTSIAAARQLAEASGRGRRNTELLEELPVEPVKV
jgi:hypothetical protein